MPNKELLTNNVVYFYLTKGLHKLIKGAATDISYRYE